MDALPVPLELRAIEAIENAYIQQIQSSPFGALLASIETLPANLSEDEIRARLKKLPGIYVAWGGGPGGGSRRVTVESDFTVFAMTGTSANEEQRRRGVPVLLGAYQLIQYLITVIHAQPLPEPTVLVDGIATPIPGLVIGQPHLVEVGGYGNEATMEMGVTIYGATFRQTTTFPPLPPPDALADFRLFIGQIALEGVPEGGGSLPLPIEDVSSEDDVQLPGA